MSLLRDKKILLYDFLRTLEQKNVGLRFSESIYILHASANFRCDSFALLVAQLAPHLALSIEHVLFHERLGDVVDAFGHTVR